MKICVKKCKIKPGILQADKGYDSQKLRGYVTHILGVETDIPRRKTTKAQSTIGEILETTKKIEEVHKNNTRWKVERTFAWLYRKYRRLAVRWERRTVYYRGFFTWAIIIFLLNVLLK